MSSCPFASQGLAGHRSTCSRCWDALSQRRLRPPWAGSSWGRGAGGTARAPPPCCSLVRRAQDRAGHGSLPSLQGKWSPSLRCWGCCAAAWGSPPSAFAANPPSLLFLCWDVSLGSQISRSSALPAASPSRADQRGSHGWPGAVCWLPSPEAQRGAEPSSAGRVHVPLLAACKKTQLLWREAEEEASLQGACIFCLCGATAREWRAGKRTHAKISVKA